MRSLLTEKDNKIKKLEKELETGKAREAASSTAPPPLSVAPGPKNPDGPTPSEAPPVPKNAPKPVPKADDPKGDEKSMEVDPIPGAKASPSATPPTDETQPPAPLPLKDAPASTEAQSQSAPQEEEEEKAPLDKEQPEEEAMGAKEVREKLVELIATFEDTEKSIDELFDKHLTKQESMLDTFCAQSHSLMKEYNTDLDPLTTRINDANKPVSKLLKSRILLLNAEDLDNLRQTFAGGPKTWTHGPQRYPGNGLSNPSKKRIRVELPPREVVLNYFNQLDRQRKTREMREQQKKRKEHEKAQREEMEKKIEQNREGGALQILSIFPFLTVEHAKTCLESCDDNLEKAIGFVSSMPAQEVFSAIQAKKLDLQQKKDREKNHGPNGLHRNFTSGLSTINRDGTKKQVCVQVVKVDDGTKVTMRTLLDRNRLPLVQPSRIYSVDLKSLCGTEFEFTDMAYVEKTRSERKLKLVYQVEDEHFIPVGVEPKDVPFQEYTPNYDHYSKKINSVSHKADGQIQFKGVLDTNKGVVDHEQPLEIHTQIIDEQTVNVVLLCVNHYTPEMTLDFLNLTLTSKTAKDCEEFLLDAAGRKHTYRIVVKEGKVIGILAPFGDEVKHLPFNEKSVPALGSLVALPGGDLALIESIPTGLIITNKDDGGVDPIPIKFKEQKPCNRRHTDEMRGFVDCRVIRRGEWLSDPLQEAHNLIYMNPPTPEQQTEYLQWVAQEESKQAPPVDEEAAFVAKIEECELLLEAIQVAEDKKTAFQELQALWSDVNKMGTGRLADKEKARRTTIGRNIRCMALDMRAGNKN